jgi:hypothetical protein
MPTDPFDNFMASFIRWKNAADKSRVRRSRMSYQAECDVVYERERLSDCKRLFQLAINDAVSKEFEKRGLHNE